MTALTSERPPQTYPQRMILNSEPLVTPFLKQLFEQGIVLGEYDLQEILTQLIQDMHSDKPNKDYFVDLPERHRMIISKVLTEEQQGVLQAHVHKLGRQLRAHILELRALDTDGVTFSYFLTELKGRDIYLEYLPW